MNNLINKDEAIKAITNDDGIQYPRWWYIKKIQAIEPETDLISRQKVIEIINERKKQWHDERATAALNDLAFDVGRCDGVHR